MKRIFALVICAILLCTFPIVAFAEGESTASVETESLFPDSFPIETETATESEISGDVTIPEEPTETITDEILCFVKENFADIFVTIALILAALYKRIKDNIIHKAIGTLNNNAVTVAENSNTAIQKALAEVEGVSAVVTGYKEQIEALISEYRANAEEKKKLEDSLAEMQTYLKTAKLANVELANELAELLVLANIPNSKKEELYSRHLAAVGAITDAEKTEVIADDGKETE